MASCSTLKSLLSAASDAEQMSLAYASIGDAGCTAVARYIRDNASLVSLDLRGNNIRANGLVILAHAVKNSPSLISLCLKWNKIGSDANDVCARGLLALSDVLVEPSCALHYLDLRNNTLKAGCVPHIADMLRRNVSLMSIDLSWNDLGEESGPHLYDALQHNSTLVNCQLSGNQFSDDVLNDIATILRNNRVSAESRPMSPIPPYSPTPVKFIPEASRNPEALVDVSVGDILSPNESDVRKLLQEKEQSDDPIYREVGDLIDLLVMDAHRAKRYLLDAELRKKVVARGFSDCELRSAGELRDLTDILERARQEKAATEERLNTVRLSVVRAKAEKEQALTDRRDLEELSNSAIEKLEFDTRDALRLRADTEADLYSLRRKMEDHKVENERLRVYLKRCKADLDSALQ